MTRARSKRVKETLQTLIIHHSNKEQVKLEDSMSHEVTLLTWTCEEKENTDRTLRSDATREDRTSDRRRHLSDACVGRKTPPSAVRYKKDLEPKLLPPVGR